MQEKRMEVPGGVLKYIEAGTGTPVVFMQGIWVSSGLWDDTIKCLGDRARIFQVEWPLGGHSEPFDPSADLSPKALVEMVLEFIERLDLQNVVLCTNDTGGGLAQMVITTDHPAVKRIGGVLLSNVDTYEYFPPPPMHEIRDLCGRYPPAASQFVLSIAGGPDGNQRYFSATCSKPVTPERQAELLENFNTNELSRADYVKFYGQVFPETTTYPASWHFHEVKIPISVVWGLDDEGFPVSHGERLVREFPNARLVRVEHAHTFVPMDDPEALTKALVDLIEQAEQNEGASS